MQFVFYFNEIFIFQNSTFFWDFQNFFMTGDITHKIAKNAILFGSSKTITGNFALVENVRLLGSLVILHTSVIL